eukprot:symbB.v1.2.000455.t1/scaffold11.1/size528188/4
MASATFKVPLHFCFSHSGFQGIPHSSRRGRQREDFRKEGGLSAPEGLGPLRFRWPLPGHTARRLYLLLRESSADLWFSRA